MTDNYADSIELAKKVVKLADEETSRGMNPTCGMTCYRLAVALLHVETTRQYEAA